MAKFYVRGEPESDELKSQIAEIRAEYDLDHNRLVLEHEFPNHTLHDMVNGQVELAAEDGTLFRLYLLHSTPTHANLVVDDYHPDEDASIKVDEYGFIEGEYDEKE